MNMENVDRVIAQILEGGESEAVTGGKSGKARAHKESPLDRTLGALGIGHLAHRAEKKPAKKHSKKNSRSRVRGGDIKGGELEVKGGDAPVAPEVPASPALAGGEAEMEGGAKKRRLPEALRIAGERQRSKVKKIYEKMRGSKRYARVPGNKLLKKAMEQSKMM